MYIRIVTERLTLEPLGPKYLETVNRYALDPENTKYMCHMPYLSITQHGGRGDGRGSPPGRPLPFD